MDSLGIRLLFWVVWCCGLAFRDGRVMPAIRRTPYGTIEQKEQDIALHWVGGFLYFWPLVFEPTWLELSVALGLRILLYDVVLNAAAGDAPFYVGKTAQTDKLLQFIARISDWNVQVLSAIFRLLAFLLLAGLVYFQR